jgi:hypothetical protein
MLMDVIQVLLGIPLLLWGRRLFWLFIGALGFLAGVYFATTLFPGATGWTPLLIALGAGLVGALLGMMVQKAAVWVAGFLAGGYLLVTLLKMLAPGNEAYTLIAFIAGGLIGAMLLAVMFESALIILSSLTGAILVAQSLPFSNIMAVVIFIVLLMIGIFVQFKQKDRD